MNEEQMNWIEAQGRARLDYGLVVFEALTTEVNTLLGFVFAAIAGLLAYVVGGVDAGGFAARPVWWGALAALLWGMGIGFAISRAKWTGKIGSPGLDPVPALAQFDDDSRRDYLTGIQKTIDFNSARIDEMAARLDSGRLRFLATPWIGLAGGGLACFLA